MPTEVEQLLSDLVAIPSMNPMGEHPLGNGFGEAEMANYVEAFFRKHSIPCERQNVLPGRQNVVGLLGGREKDAIVLEAHMDTVLGENMDIEPFKPDIKDGKLYGRGSCDTKASLAAMLLALKTAADRGNLERSVCLAATADEELKFTGVLRLIELGLNAQMAVVGEPTELNIVVAHKGCLRWEIETRGVSAHSCKPDEGENAIYRMAPVLQALDRYASTLAQEPGHPLAGGKTLSVGIIKGGQTVNTIPDRCTIQIDRRTLPDEDGMEAYDVALRFLGSELGDGSTWEALPPFVNSPGLDVDPNAQVVRQLRSACLRVSLDPEIQGVAYGTDASKLHQAGIPSIVFGPGDIRQAHSATEFVELRQVEAARSVFEALILG